MQRVVVVAVLAALLVACASLVVFGSPRGESSSGPLAKAVEQTRDERTARLSSVKRGNGLGVPYVHRAAGVVDFMHDFSSVTQRSSIGGSSVPVSREVKLGNDLYTQIGAGRSWVHERVQGGNTAFDVDPAYLLDFVQDWATRVGRVGVRRAGGVTATSYRANIDLKAAVEHKLREMGWSRSAAEEFIGDELDGRATLKVSVDSDGLIRRVVLSSSNETDTLTLSDFGVHVDARPPTA
jgi:hypothetical protein